MAYATEEAQTPWRGDVVEGMSEGHAHVLAVHGPQRIAASKAQSGEDYGWLPAREPFLFGHRAALLCRSSRGGDGIKRLTTRTRIEMSRLDRQRKRQSHALRN